VTLAARYQLNGDDGLTCLHFHDRSVRNNFWLSVVLSVAIVAIGALWLFLPGPKTGPWVSIAVGGTLLAVNVIQRALLVQRLRATWNQVEPVDLTVSENGFVLTERGAQSEVAWSRFVRFRESETHFLLYKSADIYGIVPKRAFSAPADIDAFRALAAKAIG
jgi:hypothetical protein